MAIQNKSKHEIRTGEAPYDYVARAMSILANSSPYADGCFSQQALINACQDVSSSTVRRIVKKMAWEGVIELSEPTDEKGMKIGQWVLIV